VSTRGQEWLAWRRALVGQHLGKADKLTAMEQVAEESYLHGLGEGAADWHREMQERGQKQYDTEQDLALARKDVADAAGELMVDLKDAPPGSLVAKLMIANSIMRRERDQARADLHVCKLAMEAISACAIFAPLAPVVALARKCLEDIE